MQTKNKNSNLKPLNLYRTEYSPFLLILNKTLKNPKGIFGVLKIFNFRGSNQKIKGGLKMAQQIQPIFIMSEGSQRTTGRDAQRNNIMAAKMVAETVRTTLSPKKI